MNLICLLSGLTLRRSFYILLLTIFFLSYGCYPLRPFNSTRIPAPPDYAQEKYWAALPWKKDSADTTPYGSGLKNEQENAKADVFFIYPTAYMTGRTWNANVNNNRLNQRISKSVIRHQASAFNAAGKIYAPYYRQAVLKTFFKPDKGNGKKALDLAYEDVKTAFEYYLKYYHHGRPIIIASHSQGTYHGERLIREFFDNDSLLRKKLVAAYLIGGRLKKNAFTNLPACSSAEQTGCVIAWNAFARGTNKPGKRFLGLESVNPLSWKTDTTYVPAILNSGSVPYGFNRVDKQMADAQISANGILWVKKSKKRGYPGTKNYHLIDYNLFWLNIRENSARRVEKYMHERKEDR